MAKQKISLGASCLAFFGHLGGGAAHHRLPRQPRTRNAMTISAMHTTRRYLVCVRKSSMVCEVSVDIAIAVKSVLIEGQFLRQPAGNDFGKEIAKHKKMKRKN